MMQGDSSYWYELALAEARALPAAQLTKEDDGYALLTLLAVVFLHETVSPRRWVGVLLICVGVLLVGQTRPRTTEVAVRREVAA